MRETTIYYVYRQSADSWHSVPEMPKAAFTDEEKAIEYAKAQGGYGYGHDWFVKPLTLNPTL